MYVTSLVFSPKFKRQNPCSNCETHVPFDNSVFILPFECQCHFLVSGNKVRVGYHLCKRETVFELHLISEIMRYYFHVIKYLSKLVESYAVFLLFMTL